jgi:lysophospholipase L1-like esterase
MLPNLNNLNKSGKIALYLIGGALFVSVIYLAAKNLFKGKKTPLKNKNPKKLLFIGDSLTDIDYKGKPTYTYPMKIQQKRPDLQIDVLAEGGEITKWMLDNLPNQLKRKKYDRVYIFGGLNDAYSQLTVDTAIRNNQSMVDLINKNGADAYIILGYNIDGIQTLDRVKPTRYVTTVEAFIPLIAKYKEFQKRLPNEIKNANFVPIINVDGMTTDGTHITGKAHEIFADKIISTL